MTKAIATPPGEDTKYVELTPGELAQRQAEEKAYADGATGRENSYLKLARESAYRNEADPLFFKYQRGEITEQEWLDKVNEIKLRYPYI